MPPGARRRREAANRLPPEPAARVWQRSGAARLEFFLKVAEDEVAPLGGYPERQQPDGKTRRPGAHFVSRRRSRPAVIAVNVPYAWRNAVTPIGRSA